MNLLVFGEVLFDRFGTDEKIGGAPLNFAAHCQRMGGNVRLLSAVGKDRLGRTALEMLQRLGLSADFVSVLPDAPTGVCNVTLQDGHPSYDLCRGVAYDAIPLPPRLLLPCSFDALYFGTLALRETASFHTLKTLSEGSSFREIFFDINIRQSYYTEECIDYGLSHCTIFKVSREEIAVLGLGSDPIHVCRALSFSYPNLRLILVTLDKDGSLAYDTDVQRFVSSPKPSSPVLSTVGAGDSFSAAFLCRYLAGDSLSACLDAATALSDFVVTQLEAVPDYPPALTERLLSQNRSR